MHSLWKQGGEIARTCSKWFHAESEQHTCMVCVKIMFPYSIVGRSNEFDRFKYTMDFVFWIKIEVATYIVYNSSHGDLKRLSWWPNEYLPYKDYSNCYDCICVSINKFWNEFYHLNTQTSKQSFYDGFWDDFG